jgi:hypothetical protein
MACGTLRAISPEHCHEIRPRVAIAAAGRLPTVATARRRAGCACTTCCRSAIGQARARTGKRGPAAGLPRVRHRAVLGRQCRRHATDLHHARRPGRRGDEGTRKTLADGVEISGQHDGKPFVLTVGSGTCSDGMSDNTYSLVATFRFGEIDYTGCGEAAKL